MPGLCRTAARAAYKTALSIIMRTLPIRKKKMVAHVGSTRPAGEIVIVNITIGGQKTARIRIFAATESHRSLGMTHSPAALRLNSGLPAANGSTTGELNRPAFSETSGGGEHNFVGKRRDIIEINHDPNCHR